MNASRIAADVAELERAHPEVRALDTAAEDLADRLDQAADKRDALATTLGGLVSAKAAAARADAAARAQAIRDGKPAPKPRTKVDLANETQAIDAAREKVAAANGEVADHQLALNAQEAELATLKERLRPDLQAQAEARHRDRIADGHHRLAAAVTELARIRDELAIEYGRPPGALSVIPALRNRAGEAEHWDTILAALEAATDPAQFAVREPAPSPEVDWENHDVTVMSRHLAAGGDFSDPASLVREKHERPTSPSGRAA